MLGAIRPERVGGIEISSVDSAAEKLSPVPKEPLEAVFGLVKHFSTSYLNIVLILNTSVSVRPKVYIFLIIGDSIGSFVHLHGQNGK